jgi:hypothetical protein
MKAIPAELRLVPDRVRSNSEGLLPDSEAGVSCRLSRPLTALDDQVAELSDCSMTARPCQDQPCCLPNRGMSIGNRNRPADETHWAKIIYVIAQVGSAAGGNVVRR